jgi:hypothetical protein
MIPAAASSTSAALSRFAARRALNAASKAGSLVLRVRGIGVLCAIRRKGSTCYRWGRKASARAPRHAGSLAFLSNANHSPFHKIQDLNLMIKYWILDDRRK